MVALWRAISAGYMRLIEPIVDWCVRHRFSANSITTVGTLSAVLVGWMFARGWIHTAGWTLGVLAFFDVVDGAVARRTGTATAFGSFYDATMDRVADGAMLGGIAWFYATAWVPRHREMLAVTLVALVATFLTSYIRSRAELIGIGMKGIGWMERPERITLLAAPQAFFGRALNGFVMDSVVVLLAATALITVVQRVRHVAREAAILRPGDGAGPAVSPARPGDPR